MNSNQQSDERAGLPSASGMSKLYHCAGSAAAEREAPHEVPSDEAQQGTDIHDALESGDLSGLDDDGRTIAERLKAMERDAMSDWLNEISTAASEFREKRLWIKSKDGTPLASAKLDVYFLAPPYALAIDFKSGYLPVTGSERNAQCRIQALAILSEHTNINHIRVGTAQFRFKGSIDTCDYGPDSLKQASRELEFMLWRASQPDAPRTAGAHCRYCRAKATCMEAAAYSLLPVPLAGGVLKLKDEAIAEIVSRQPLDVLAHVYRHKAIAVKIFDAVSDRLKALDATTLKSVGLEVGEPIKVRQIKDVAQAWGTLSQSMSQAEFCQCCKLAIGKIEEILIEKLTKDGKMTKVAAKSSIAELISPVVEFVEQAGRLKELKS